MVATIDTPVNTGNRTPLATQNGRKRSALSMFFTSPCEFAWTVTARVTDHERDRPARNSAGIDPLRPHFTI